MASPRTFDAPRATKRGARAALLAALVLSASGCGTLHYLLQAGKGQLALINRARPINEVIQDERTPPRIARLLARIPDIKKFGETQGLKATKNYQDYVKLDRTAAVYVVSASEQLQFKSKEWGFPIVGKFPYLGWFDLQDAREYAKQLRDEGWDVDLRGARAYSTLGYFRDSVLSTMIPGGDEALGELVNVVLHESVHATLYVSGQAYFNESIASWVAGKLTDQYFDQKGLGASPEKTAYDQGEREGEKTERKLHETYEALRALYASPKSDAEKLEQKHRILEKVKDELKWKRDIGNATLLQFKTYNVGKAEFEEFFRACQGDWTRFWRNMKTIGEKSFAHPQQEDLAPVILPLVKKGCP